MFAPEAGDGATPHLVGRDGRRTAVQHRRWHDEPGPADLALLDLARGPVLDIGCGPGRLVHALVRSGRPALGIDASAAAVSATRRRGAPAVHASVFGPVPAAGTWGTALLVDGNIGIGGDAAILLRRTAALLAEGGRILVELDPPAATSAEVEVGAAVEVGVEVRVETGGEAGPWFLWSPVAVGDIHPLADRCGLVVAAVWEHSGRCFAVLVRERADDAQEAAS